MWSSIFKVLSGAAKVITPLVQAGTAIYTAKKQKEAAEIQAQAATKANKQARQQQLTLMSSTQAAADAQKMELAKQTSALESMLKSQQDEQKRMAAVTDQEKKRQKRALIHTNKDTWLGAAPVIKPTASNALAAMLGG